MQKRSKKTTRANEYCTQYSVQYAQYTVSYTVVIKKHGFDEDGQYSCGTEYRYTVRLGSTYPQSAGWYTDKKEETNFLKYREIQRDRVQSHI
jgi:hypothetical protein